MKIISSDYKYMDQHDFSSDETLDVIERLSS